MRRCAALLCTAGLRAASTQAPATRAFAAAAAGPRAVGAVLNDILSKEPSPAAPAALPTTATLRAFSAAAEPAPNRNGTEAPSPTFKGGSVPFEPARNQAESSYVAENNGSRLISPGPVYSPEYLESIRPTHLSPVKLHQKVGFWVIRAIRSTFDFATGYEEDKMTEAKWLRRIIFLETVAGVPGMVAGMLRHLASLRTMRRDRGWIHTLLSEAENERLHLLTFLQLRQPGLFLRAIVLLAQGVYFNLYFLAYLVSPKMCHSMVGYLEEEAVRTYTHALKEINEGRLWKDKPAPDVAVSYWKLRPDATMRDVVLVVRADEASHSHVNHTFAALSKYDDNPFRPGAHQVP